MKPITWLLVISLIGIAFDSLLLMDDTTRFWLLIALVIFVVCLAGFAAAKSMSLW